MATSFFEFEVTVPAGTVKASPQVTDLSLPPGFVTAIEWRVPPGPRGEVGFALGAAGEAVIPRTLDTYIVADNDKQTWQLDSAHDSGSWQVFVYNTGSYDHTLYFSFAWDPPTGPPSVAGVGGATIPNAALGSSPVYGQGGTVVAAPSPSGLVPASSPAQPSTVGVGQGPAVPQLPAQSPPPTTPAPPPVTAEPLPSP